MSKPLSMTYDRKAGAGYIALTGEPIGETVEVENTTLPFGVNVDLDASGKPTGLELLGQVGGTADQFLSSIADGSLGGDSGHCWLRYPQACWPSRGSRSQTRLISASKISRARTEISDEPRKRASP